MKVLRAGSLGVRTGLMLLASLSVPAVSGLLLQDVVSAFGLYLSRLPSDAVSSFADVKSNLAFYGSTLAGFFEPAPTGLPLLGAVIAGALISAKKGDALQRLFIVYWVSVMAVLSLSFLTKSVTAGRYLIPFVYAFAVFLAVSVGSVNRVYAGLITVLFVLSAVFGIYKGFATKAPEQNQEALNGYLKKQGLTYGFSTYWNSNIVTVFSGNEIRIRPVYFDGLTIKQYNWTNKADWYAPSRHEGATFLLVPDDILPGEMGSGFSYLSPVVLERMYGRPSRTLKFQEKTIYEWPYNIMKANLPSVKISETTPHAIGRLDGDALRAGPGERGLLLYGPYWALREGRYRVRFLLRVEGPNKEEAAVLDVTMTDVAAQKTSTLQTASVPAEKAAMSQGLVAPMSQGLVAPEWREHSIDFEAGENKQGNLIYEFRVFATGKAVVSVAGVSLEPL